WIVGTPTPGRGAAGGARGGATAMGGAAAGGVTVGAAMAGAAFGPAGGVTSPSGVGAVDFSTIVVARGSGANVTTGRELAHAGRGGATDSGTAEAGSDGTVTGAPRSHQESPPASSTAFTPSATSSRPDTSLQGARGRGRGDRSRCTTGTCWSRCRAAFVSA